MLRYLSALLLLPVVLGGCAVGPDYHRPRMAVESSYGPLPGGLATRPHATTTHPSRTARWWTNLSDPVLDDLIARAIRANHDVRLAAAHVREARARRAVVAGGQWPSVDARAAATHSRSSRTIWPLNEFNVPGFPWESNLYQFGFDAAWEIDVFGGVRRGVEAADATLGASVEARRGVLVSVLAEVARNYVELRTAQQEYAIAARNLASQRETLALTKDQARRGVAPELYVSRAAAQVHTTAASLPQLRRLEWQAMHRLAVLTGQQPGALVKRLSVEKPIPTPPAEVAVGVPAELLRRRPDIRRAERDFAAATARIGVAEADLYPKFTLNGSFVLESARTDSFLRWDSRSFGIGPAMKWPIFQAGALRAMVQVRNAQQEQALVVYEKTVLQAISEVHDALVAFQTEQQRQESLRQAVKANQTSADLATDLYKKGLVDFTTVLDAQRQLYRTQELWVQSTSAVTTAWIALYKALGGGWERDSASTPSAGQPATRPAPPTTKSPPHTQPATPKE